ncbi:MAG: amidohydrolase [Anaerolineae bacterium]|nr:amidohydrolase [Anaerolineae bacterium]
MSQVNCRAEAEALRERLVSWRRDFHRHPELALQEHHSAGIIAEKLQELGYDVETGMAKTGVVALLEADAPGPVVMARFDMDALPIVEANETDYVSQNPGVMHGCGHDGHMAIGLGVATLMARHREALSGTLKLVFQPGEEGGDGAQMMVNEGVLEDPHPDVALITHLWNEKPVGTVNVTPGAVMAAAEKWACTVHGKGGHGALPHQTVDPIVAASHIVTALQTVVSRNVSPLETAVVTVGSFQGGDAFNVIPDRVDMSGTIRTYDPDVRERVLRRMVEVAEHVAAACGASVDLEIDHLTPAVVNDAEVSEVVREAARAVVGPQNVESGERTMGSEDAAYFIQEVPGCYFFVGSANAERGLDAPHHNPHFDFDEAALPIGVAVMTEAIMRYL